MVLVATPREPPGSTFDRAVILLVDAEPNGIVAGICINRPLETRVVDSSALALLFVPEPDAHAFWGGPMGSDPAILAQFHPAATDGLEWFHLPIQQRRPFPLPDVGVIAVAEHTAPFEDRILRARLFVGLCVWGRGQLEREVANGDWQVRAATADDIFSPQPEHLWAALTGQ
ncbi:MAG: YqgE/AlgH family protein [Chloroflexi bacterium]|nr:YqgE/AlgH family protein [Chloroflexota bacterium]